MGFGATVNRQLKFTHMINGTSALSNSIVTSSTLAERYHSLVVFRIVESRSTCARASHAKAHFHHFQYNVRRRLGVRVRQGAWIGHLRLRYCRQAQAHGQEMRCQEDPEHQYEGECVLFLLTHHRSWAIAVL